MDLFKDIISSILVSKKDLSGDDSFNKTYNPYIVNKALSFHYDAIMQSNEMNQFPHLDKKMQYSYYINNIRGYKRPFRKWQKRETIEDLEAIKEYYNYSDEKAKEALVLLNAAQIETIKKQLNKGGTNDSKPRRLRGNKTTRPTSLSQSEGNTNKNRSGVKEGQNSVSVLSYST